MERNEAYGRYYSRESLQTYLESKFGKLNFKINRVGDGHYTFEAPRKLDSVSPADEQSNEYLANPDSPN